MELVTIPRNVADAIERMKSAGADNFEIIQKAAGNYHGRNYDADSVWGYVKEERSERLTVIMRALLDGYNVDPTPQEKLREYYEGLVKEENSCELNGLSGSQFRQGWQSIKETLDILGVKVEGINA